MITYFTLFLSCIFGCFSQFEIYPFQFFFVIQRHVRKNDLAALAYNNQQYNIMHLIVLSIIAKFITNLKTLYNTVAEIPIYKSSDKHDFI